MWVGGPWLDMATSFATLSSAVASIYVVSGCSEKESMCTVIFRMNTWSLYESGVITHQYFEGTCESKPTAPDKCDKVDFKVIELLTNLQIRRRVLPFPNNA